MDWGVSPAPPGGRGAHAPALPPAGGSGHPHPPSAIVGSGGSRETAVCGLVSGARASRSPAAGEQAIPSPLLSLAGTEGGGAAFSPEGGAGHDASQSRCWCSPRGTALQGPPIRNPPLHQKPEKELGAPPQEGGLGVYLTFGPSPRKSSSLKADGNNEQFAATSERARGRSARNVLTVRRHLSRVPVLEATAVLGPAPPSGCSLRDQPPLAERRAPWAFTCSRPTSAQAPSRCSRCFLWLPHARERMFVPRYFSFPVGQRGREFVYKWIFWCRPGLTLT